MSNTDYDVIIIGAGISGLVCGCYLAKAGLKTLIIEKNARPGGYCTSFVREGYHFDACVHALSSLRKGAILDKFLKDLELRDEFKFRRYDPSDIIITPDCKINFFHDFNRTIDEFQQYFPKQKQQIYSFFKFIESDLFFEHRKKTFTQTLDFYFDDYKLKSIFSTLILQLLGFDPSKISTIAACLIFREFIFDGGYYPKGGLQVFPDTLAKQYIKYGGKIIYSTNVRKIKIFKEQAKGVLLDNSKSILAKFTVSASNTTKIFSELINDKNICKLTLNLFNKLSPSMSAFIAYIGTSRALKNIPELKSNIFLINSYDFSKLYHSIDKLNNQFAILHAASIWDETLNKFDKDSVWIGTNANYFPNNLWQHQEREKGANKLIKLAENLIPGLSENICVLLTATPLTLAKWTGNPQGAAFGWASTIEQFGNPDTSQQTKISNLYTTGHWSNQSSGISFVANCGFDTANLIIKRINKES